MLLKEHPEDNFLIGGVDSISEHDYNIEVFQGWYRANNISNKTLYKKNENGTMAGEGAGFFIVSGKSENAIAKIEAFTFFETKDSLVFEKKLKDFLELHTPGSGIDLLLSGENGDQRQSGFYAACEKAVGEKPVARFKHMCGEYPTASAFGLWIAAHILKTQMMPTHMAKAEMTLHETKNILLYNTYRGEQHSLLLVSTL